ALGQYGDLRAHVELWSLDGGRIARLGETNMDDTGRATMNLNLDAGFLGTQTFYLYVTSTGGYANLGLYDVHVTVSPLQLTSAQVNSPTAQGLTGFSANTAMSFSQLNALLTATDGSTVVSVSGDPDQPPAAAPAVADLTGVSFTVADDQTGNTYTLA